MVQLRKLGMGKKLRNGERREKKINIKKNTRQLKEYG
jgi:hypothetical protein